ncbi:site-2 protease family protein [Staphylospora marina]|uniref:site-2 protease family protein n=1 Tax=Staphylospora marina TaxID=2490858 RepID=UPI001F14CB20|nr:site-2 protease family protein [Staphylospora marina]
MSERKTERPRSKWFTWLAGMGFLVASLGGKLKSILTLLKFGKFGSTLFSMFLSVGVYALIYPWQFAIGLVLMLLIHEMGHVWAAKRKGLPVSAPAFIPFVGALITMKRQPADAATEAYIAFGGPLLGTLGAVFTHALGVWTGEHILLVIAMVGYFINLFNLVPIHPLDGGRIVTAVSRWLWVVGLVAGFVMILYLRSILLALIYILFVMELWSTFGRRKPKAKTIPLEVRVPLARFEETGLSIPEERQSRELLFRQYCLVETQDHRAAVEDPALGTMVEFPFQGDIRSAKLVRTFAPGPEESEVRMVVEIEAIPESIGGIRKDKRYYQVPARLRWGFGLAYFGLAAFLAWMLTLIGNLPIQG